MAEVKRFEEKVNHAMSLIMRHAVAGHSGDTTLSSGFNTFCNNPEHAQQILREQGITPMNTAIVERLLDTGIS